MILDVDIGNTRVKWRVEGHVYSALRSDTWLDQLAASAKLPGRVRVANVGGAEVDNELARMVLSRWGLEAEFAVTSESAAGVSCCYEEPSRLGVDRWLALVAAWKKENRALVVVDAGSAITVDAVSNDGRQQGGFIVPGLDMQRQALFSGTSRVRVHADWSKASPKLGQDTLSAVQNGALATAIGLVEYVANYMMPGAALYLTGGDANLIAPHLSVSSVVVPDLVLDGLAVLLP